MLDPPGLSTEFAAAAATAAAQSSVGIMRDSPVADDDLTMEEDEVERDDLLEDPSPVTRGLGVLGSTDSLGVTGRLRGPALVSVRPQGVLQFLQYKRMNASANATLVYLKDGGLDSVGVTGVTGGVPVTRKDSSAAAKLNLGSVSLAPDLRLRRCSSGETSTSESVWLDSGVDADVGPAATAATGVAVVCSVDERGLDVLWGPEEQYTSSI